MRKNNIFYNIFIALIISLLFSACGNITELTGKTENASITSTPSQPNQTEPTQQDSLSQEIIFQSSEIERRTRELLGKPEGAITKEDVLAITEFSIDDTKDVVCEKPFLDLRWYRNLESVTLRDCGVESLEGVEALTALKTLSVDNFFVDAPTKTDISALGSLTQLEELSLANNQISDISLLKGFTNLKVVSLENNNITDICPLENCRKLQEVWLNNNNITFIGTLKFCQNLEKVSLGGNNITDISPLASCRKLQEVWLGKNKITDISPLAGCRDLKKVWLGGNNITDISPLASCRKLEGVWLGKNNITDITPLYELNALKEIDLGENHVSGEELQTFYEVKSSTPIIVTQTGKLREDMPEFMFVLTAFYDLQWKSYALQTVDVYQGDALLQTISIPELTLSGQTRIIDSLQDTLGFELEDLNFDGYLDMRLFDTLNGNYRREWVYLVWNPEGQQFEHDARLNEIVLASFDQEEQLIHSMESGGATRHYFSTYQYIDGEIVKIRYYEEEVYYLYLSEEWGKQYYDIASVKTSGVSFDVLYEHTMERNAASGELETVCEEYVFIPYDSDGKQIENEEEELHVDVYSALGEQISEDLSR